MASAGGVMAAASVGDVADLVGAIAWPAVIVAAVVILRKPLRAFIENVGTSASSVSIGPGGLKVDFAAAVTKVAPEGATVLSDLRSPAPALADSAAPTMFAQLATEEPAPHLLVDLGEGREWLSSRLYLFAVMLASMRRTRTLIFVATLNGIGGSFVGLASPLRVRYALAREYPWLEADFAAAYAQATMGWKTPLSGPVNAQLVLDDQGRLSQLVAQDLVRGFLGNVRLPSAGALDPGQWIDDTVGSTRINERAQWLAAADVERIFGESLDRWAYISETEPRSESEIAAQALRLSGHDSVALLDDRRRFKGAVVDRRKALEALAAQAAADKSLAG